MIETKLKRLYSVKLKFANPKELVNKAKLQTLFSIGDKVLTKILLNFYLNGGTMGALRKAEKELDFDTDNYLLKIQNGYVPWKIK